MGEVRPSLTEPEFRTLRMIEFYCSQFPAYFLFHSEGAISSTLGLHYSSPANSKQAKSEETKIKIH